VLETSPVEDVPINVPFAVETIIPVFVSVNPNALPAPSVSACAELSIAPLSPTFSSEV